MQFTLKGNQASLEAANWFEENSPEIRLFIATLYVGKTHLITLGLLESLFWCALPLTKEKWQEELCGRKT